MASLSPTDSSGSADAAALAKLRGLQVAPSPTPSPQQVPRRRGDHTDSGPFEDATGSRSLLRTAGGLFALLLAVGVGGLTAFASQAPAGVPLSAQRPGSCHLAIDPDELVAIPSDSTPPVPCTQPHQTETMWVDRVTGPLAAATARPNGQLLNQTLGGQCFDYRRVRTYVGAGPSDVVAGIASHVRFPTVAAWAAGDRTLVCQASVQGDPTAGPTTTVTLAGILRRAGSAPFRLCSRPGSQVTCAQPHTTEATSPDIVLPAGPWPGRVPALARATRACRPLVEAYLGAKLRARPELVVLTDGPSEAAWAQGNRSANCSIDRLLWMSRSAEALLVGLSRGAEHGRDGAPGGVVLPGAGDCRVQPFAGVVELVVDVGEQAEWVGHGVG